MRTEKLKTENGKRKSRHVDVTTGPFVRSSFDVFRWQASPP